MKPCPFCGSSDIRYSLKTGTQYFKRIYHAGIGIVILMAQSIYKPLMFIVNSGKR